MPNKQQNKRILFFSNLFPLPWEPTRGQFNLQQTAHMEENADISYLIPVPIFTWLKQVVLGRKYYDKKNYCLFPFFYIPGVARSLHPLFMLLSIIVSVKPLFWFAKHKYVLASWAYPEGVTAAMLKQIFSFQLTIDCLGSDVNVHSLCPKRKKQLSFAFNRATTVATKSKALAIKVLEISPQANVQTIYNGVNFEKFNIAKKPDTNKYNLLFIGNLIKTKGVFELLIAAKKLANEKVDFELSIIGSGPEESHLASYIVENDLSASVKLIGGVPHEQLDQWFARSHALILPSYREGVPNVIMEALATGTAVVATKVGGIPEVITHKVNGILLNDYQSDSIYKGIKQVMAEIWVSESILKSVENYTWENTSKQFLQTFS
ncbi:glycosyltransferase [Colwellia sp. BRX8-7]|uniref:glycosyltransferase n=1 Tax=Colwellia sp. BRX8-7 TaxID=2759833 RepID=UPI0015F59CC9|nr:glycosyltransferase [Colwellia sp. BRX8-7]MBA6336418.1 glycosyltransferase [Colwellia sp. BRX8-7]